jgi:hypothetical protein
LREAFQRRKMNRITRDFDLAVRELELLTGASNSKPGIRARKPKV